MFLKSLFLMDFKKLLGPLIILFIIAAIGFGIKFAFSSYENLQLENKKLILQIQKLEKDLKDATEINKENIKTIETAKQSCENSLSEVKGFYEGRESLLIKEVSVLKSRKAKEQAIKTGTKTNPDGTIRDYSDKEIEEGVSAVRIDSIFESFCNNNEDDICKDIK